MLRGLNRPSQAIDWWQKFIKESPAGPWRGQAHVALVDLPLESQLDLTKATEHAIVATTALAKDSASRPSRRGTRPPTTSTFARASFPWSMAASTPPFKDSSRRDSWPGTVPIFLRRKCDGPLPPEVQAGLNRLIEAAEHRVKLVPDELAVGDDRATLALVIGNIYNVLHQYDLAKGYFSLPLNGSLRSRSAGHRSFAGLGLARAVLASGQPISSSKSPASSTVLQAKAICEASLKEYPKGSWHDETLYRLATVIQDMAEAKFGNHPFHRLSMAGNRTSPRNSRSTTQRLRGSGLSHSPKRRPRPCHTGKGSSRSFPIVRAASRRCITRARCFTTWQRPCQAASPTQMAKDADPLFQRLCERYPKSPYVGDACVRQIDFALERKYDLKLATPCPTRDSGGRRTKVSRS